MFFACGASQLPWERVRVGRRGEGGRDRPAAPPAHSVMCYALAVCPADSVEHVSRPRELNRTSCSLHVKCELHAARGGRPACEASDVLSARLGSDSRSRSSRGAECGWGSQPVGGKPGSLRTPTSAPRRPSPGGGARASSVTWQGTQHGAPCPQLWCLCLLQGRGCFPGWPTPGCPLPHSHGHQRSERWTPRLSFSLSPKLPTG